MRTPAARQRLRAVERRKMEDIGFQARFAREIRNLFPSCRGVRAEAIALHAASRGSGRVGRSAAGRALDEEAVRLAVVASVRHQDTPYDERLMSGVDRASARDRVQDAVDAVLEVWARRAEG